MKKKLTVLLVLILIVCVCVSTTAAGVLYYLRTRENGTITLTPETSNSVDLIEPHIQGTTLIYKVNNSDGNYNVSALIPELGMYKNFNKNVTGYFVDVNKLYVVINVPAKRDNLFVKIDLVNNNVDWVQYKYDLDCFYSNPGAYILGITIDRTCFSKTGDQITLDLNTGSDISDQFPVSSPR